MQFNICDCIMIGIYSYRAITGVVLLIFPWGSSKKHSRISSRYFVCNVLQSSSYQDVCFLFFFFLFWLLTCLEMIVSMFQPINICKIVRLSCKIFHFNVIGPKTLFSVRYDTFVLCFMKVVQFLLPWILCKKLILYLLFLVSSTKEVSYSTEQYSVTINMVLIKIICNDDVTNFHTEFFDQSMELD